MTNDREQTLSAEYSRLHEKLSEIFYNEDPDGMGVTVGAPDDEYSPEVTKLIVELKKEDERSGVAKTIREMYPTAEEKLIDQVYEAWRLFLAEIRSPSSD